MTQHFIAWNPETDIAYRADTEVAAKGAVMGSAALGGASWTRARASGWRISVLDVPEPRPEPPPVAAPQRRRAR